MQRKQNKGKGGKKEKNAVKGERKSSSKPQSSSRQSWLLLVATRCWTRREDLAALDGVSHKHQFSQDAEGLSLGRALKPPRARCGAARPNLAVGDLASS